MPAPTTLPPPEEHAALAPQKGSPVWRAFNDVRLLATAGYATLLQVAHPTVGAGVHQYSSFTKDPWGRLLRTLDYVHGTIYGGPEVAGAIGARVRTMHRTIKGRRADGVPYHAMEPGAFAWVHATLASAIFEGYRVLATPMDDAARQAFWTQWRDVGRLVGVRHRDLPEDIHDVDAYLTRTIEEELDWTPAVPDLLATLRGTAPPPGVPVPAGAWRLLNAPLARHLTLTSIGLLPPVLRERLDVPWSDADERAFRRLAWLSRAAGPAVRGPLASFGPMYVRWRRDVLRAEVSADARRRATRSATAAA